MRIIGNITRGLLLLGGTGSIAYGAWLAWPPAGFIVGGALAIVGFIIDAKGRTEEPADGRSE